LVLRAYEIWGAECLAHIDGDLAFAIWDARRHEAFCARDRMGLKPFVYYWSGRSLVFASEPEQYWAPDLWKPLPSNLTIPGVMKSLGT
jgi:asparagine synthetase B (glutamine-hydrolysing)